MKQKIQYVNLFEDMEFTLRLLSGEFDDKIKKGKMKIEPVNQPRQETRVIEVGDVVLTEVPLDEIIPEPVIDEEVEEVEEQAPKCTDIEKAIAVLDGSCTDMTSEDFDSEVWAEANELYYSMEDVDYTEEKELGVGTVISFSNKGLGDFFNARIESIESWDEDEGTEGLGAETNEYVYEDDEINVNECDVTIMSFTKVFSCMMPRAA